LSLWLDIRSMSVTIGNIFIITIYFLFGFFQSVGDPVGERSPWDGIPF
jgi:OPA family glycerol-3-phosphate transporter-like MFS transporter 1/2